VREKRSSVDAKMEAKRRARERRRTAVYRTGARWRRREEEDEGIGEGEE
jgi:hypothetical protein